MAWTASAISGGGGVNGDGRRAVVVVVVDRGGAKEDVATMGRRWALAVRRRGTREASASRQQQQRRTAFTTTRFRAAIVIPISKPALALAPPSCSPLMLVACVATAMSRGRHPWLHTGVTALRCILLLLADAHAAPVSNVSDDATSYAFDLVMSVDSFYLSKDKAKLIPEIARILVPEGVLVFSDIIVNKMATDAEDGKLLRSLSHVFGHAEPSEQLLDDAAGSGRKLIELLLALAAAAGTTQASPP